MIIPMNSYEDKSTEEDRKIRETISNNLTEVLKTGKTAKRKER